MSSLCGEDRQVRHMTKDKKTPGKCRRLKKQGEGFLLFNSGEPEIVHGDS